MRYGGTYEVRMTAELGRFDVVIICFRSLAERR